MTRAAVFILVLNFALSLCETNENPTIKIQTGTLQGGAAETQNGRLYYYFTGIPYAKPPVGWYRFEAPSAVKSWDGTFDATRSPPVCPQFAEKQDFSKVIGDEDCLYLNVYTPQLPEHDSKLLPVMFYIDGEDFEYGDASKARYGPELLLDKNVVLVTINYRLGALGFFLTEDGSVTGNMGLKDQAFALDWVKTNIVHFGGNPDKITVFGNGNGGGVSAHAHMLSPLSKDLISGVIAQSGTVFNSYGLSPIQVVGIRCKTLAGILKCPTNTNPKDMVKCLKTLKGSAIVNSTSVLRRDGPIQIFKPIIERDPVGAFFPVDPVQIVQSGAAANVPFVSGITTKNGATHAAMVLSNPKYLESINSDFESAVSRFLHYGETAIVRDRPVIGKQINTYYFKDKKVNESMRKQLTKMFTDGLFLEGLSSSTDLHLKYSKQPVYNYLFGYRGSESYINKLTVEKSDEVSHKDELLYLFKNNVDFPNYEPSESDKEVTELLTSLWANFATYGNPTPPEDPSISVKWNPVQKGQGNYYYIESSQKVELKQNMFTNRATFWKNLVLDSRRKKIRDEL